MTTQLKEPVSQNGNTLQPTPEQVRLQQQVDLDARVGVLLARRLVGQARRQLAQDLLLAVPDGDRLELGRRRDDLEQALCVRIIANECESRKERQEGTLTLVLAVSDMEKTSMVV